MYSVYFVVFPGIVVKMNTKRKSKLLADFMMSQECLNLMCAVIQFFVWVCVMGICATL